MRNGLLAVTAAIALAGNIWASAQATPIVGAISFSDGGVTVPPVPSTSIVSALNIVTQGPPAANACSGSFTAAAPACNLAGAPTAGTINLLAPAGTVYTYGGFIFTLSTVGNIDRIPLDTSHVLNLGTDALEFTMVGVITGPSGFDPSLWAGRWTGQGVCFANDTTCIANTSASYSASVVAVGQPTVVSEPGTLALLGTALIGFWFLAHRRRRRRGDTECRAAA